MILLQSWVNLTIPIDRYTNGNEPNVKSILQKSNIFRFSAIMQFLKVKLLDKISFNFSLKVDLLGKILFS